MLENYVTKHAPELCQKNVTKYVTKCVTNYVLEFYKHM